VLKVLDFGISKLMHLDTVSRANDATDPKLTLNAGMVGSPQFMSPEQMKTPNDVDGRSDIWSIGGHPLPAAHGHARLRRQVTARDLRPVLNDEPVSVAERAPELPAELTRIVERCLEKDRARRYGSARELAEELRAVLEALPPKSPSPKRALSARDDAQKLARSSSRSPSCVPEKPRPSSKWALWCSACHSRN